MDNKALAKAFKKCSQLMELHNDNPFRTKAMASASFKIDKLPFSAQSATEAQLSEQAGIGKGSAEKIHALLTTGSFPELDALLAKTPEGIVEMLSIKGLGPKKVQVIWKDLALETVGELYYACNENRLIEAKGFGLKTQEDIKKAIEFAMASQGWFLYAKAEPFAERLLASCVAQFPEPMRLDFTGDYRRKLEVLAQIAYLTTIDSDSLGNFLNTLDYITDQSLVDQILTAHDDLGFTYQFHFTDVANYADAWLITTGAAAHITQLKTLADPLPHGESEKEIYAAIGLAYIEPELREGLDEIALAKSDQLPKLITFADLKGSLHNHSTYSDGVHSLSEMAQYCKDELGLDYFGICDHSKTAVYANGLSIERVQEQWLAIEQLNEKLAPFKIFKGIESDILADGSLDYPNEILAGFDFVVASVHSNLKMDEEKATQRLITAIENPYTSILGHPTGRLLLSRAGYPLDFKKVIDACAANQVVIEINANPLRLDLDWRWHRYALSKGVLLAINPDAHRTEGLWDMKHGIQVARKGGLSAANCLNTFSTAELETLFAKKK